MEFSDEEDVESEDEAGDDMNIAGGAADEGQTTTTSTTSGGNAASDEQERKKEQSRVIEWLLHCYAVLGKPGESIQKSDVYQDYLDECATFSDITFTPTFFGKLVKRAFPGIKDMRKGPRGSAKQHYAQLQRQTSDNPPVSAESREGDVQRAAPKPNIVFRHYHPSRFAAAGQVDPHAASSAPPDSTGPEGGGGGGGAFGGGGGGGRPGWPGGGEEEPNLTWVSEGQGKKRKAASGERPRGGKDRKGRRSKEGDASTTSTTSTATTSDKADSDDIGEQIRNLLLGEKGLPIAALSTLVDDKGDIDLTLLPMLGRPVSLPSDPSLSTSTSTTSSAFPAPSPNAPSGAGGSAASPTGPSSVTSSSPELTRRVFLSSILRQRVGAKANAARSPSASTPPSSSVPSPQLTGSGEADTEMRLSAPRQYLPSPPVPATSSLLPADQLSYYPPQPPPPRSYQQQHHLPRQHPHPHSHHHHHQQHQHTPYYFYPPHSHHQPHHHPPPPPPPHYAYPPPHHHHHHPHPPEYGPHSCPACYQEEVMEEAHASRYLIPPPQQPPPPSSSIPRSHSSPSLSTYAGESSYSHSSAYPTSRSRFSASRSSTTSAPMPTSASGGPYTPPPVDHPYSLPPAPGFAQPPYSPPQGVPQPMHAPIAPAPQRVRPQDYAHYPQHRSSPPMLYSPGDSLLGPAGSEEDLLTGLSFGRQRGGGRLYHSNPLPTHPQRYQQYVGGDAGDSMPSVPTPPSLSPTLTLPASRSGPPPPTSGSRGLRSSGGAPSGEQLFYGQQQQQQHLQLQQPHAPPPLDYFPWDQLSSEDNKYQGE